MRRPERVNVDWETPAAPNYQWEHAAIEVLMDIRAELQKLNATLNCRNFQRIPHKLDRIGVNTEKPNRKKVAK